MGMKKKIIKEMAQDRLLSAMMIAFNRLSDSGLDEAEKEILYNAMDQQTKRVEKLFGFIPGTFRRGV